MKKIIFLGIVLVGFGSCVNQRQKSNITGRTDEVYFTPSDTRIKGYLSKKRTNTPKHEVSKSYTGSYADRLCNFSSTKRFNYSYGGLAFTPSLMYDDYNGWSFGYIIGDAHYNGAYYPNCGCRPSFIFTYNDQDYYRYNIPVKSYNSHPFGYGYYGKPYYNSYYNPYRSYTFNKYNYGTRIGLIGFSKHHTTTASSTTTDSNTKKSENTSWWNNSSGSSSSGNRNTSGNTNSSTRRR